MSEWRIELLGKAHDRAGFDCGVESLNVFLRNYAGQNARQDVSRTYVAVASEGEALGGYYTLSTGAVAFEDLPDDLARRLPRYPVPSAHVGRLAVDKRRQGQGLGRLLLANALKRVQALADAIGLCIVTVDALDDRARSFYEAFGFAALRDDPNHLFMPMATIRKL